MLCVFVRVQVGVAHHLGADGAGFEYACSAQGRLLERRRMLAGLAVCRNLHDLWGKWERAFADDTTVCVRCYHM